MRTVKLVALWIASGIVIGGVFSFVAGAAAAVWSGSVAELRPVAGAGMYYLGTFLSFFVMASPGVLAVCCGWPCVVRRIPSIENWLIVISVLTVSAIAVTVAVRLLVLGPGTDPRVLALPFLASWMPLALPRLFIPSLRPGSFDRVAS